MKRMLDLEIDYNGECNLSCSYCVLKITSRQTQKCASLDSILKYVDNYIRHNGFDSVRLRLSSCEPLLVIDDLITILNYLNRRNIYIELNLVTNGTIVDERLILIRSLVDRIILSISIDEVSSDYQSERKYKNGDSLKTTKLLKNASMIEELTDTKAIFTSVVTNQSKQELIDQIKYFKSINRKNLLQFNALVNVDITEDRFDIVQLNKENDCTLDCLNKSNKICIDFNGDIYFCRAQKTIGMKPVKNIQTQNYELLNVDFSRVNDVVSPHYTNGKCPLIFYYTQGEFNE